MIAMDPWLLLLLPLFWLLYAWRLLRPRAALPAASVLPFAELPRSLRSRLVHLPLTMLALALSLLTLAAARPVTRDVMPLREEGVDIMLVLDLSSSMLETDMDNKETTRIQAAKEKAQAFAQDRKHDRVGLLVFALYPELRCPLTLDQDALLAFLRSVEAKKPRSPENRTGIGRALAKAVGCLDESKAESKVIVLLSDGENNVQDILPKDAASLAKDAGVKVHTIGVGNGDYHPILGVQPLEFQSLRSIAKTTDGLFFAARSGDELAKVYAQINQMEKVELEDPRYRTVDWFVYPFALGVGLLALALLLEFVWIRALP